MSNMGGHHFQRLELQKYHYGSKILGNLKELFSEDWIRRK